MIENVKKLVPVDEVWRTCYNPGGSFDHMTFKDVERQLRRDGWRYIISHDAWASPALVAELNAGCSLSEALS